jgi:hypothetical protein
MTVSWRLNQQGEGGVHLLTVLMLMGVLPIGSIVVQALVQNNLDNWILLIGRWFGFWTFGVRMILAGVQQAMRPELAARNIFEIKSKASLPAVQTLGFACMAMGALGTLSILIIHWIVPSAIVGAIFYGFSGITHLRREKRGSSDTIATVSEMSAFVVLLGYLILSQL